jgi:endonuclease/exonuclease/phosphatase family metal-dependent hydrolase
VPEIVVATFNIHGGVDGWGRPFDVVDACRRLDADVLVLEELWIPAGIDSAEELGAVLGYESRSLAMAPGRLRPPPSVAGRRWRPSWPRHRFERGLWTERSDGRHAGARPRAGMPGAIGLALLSRLPLRWAETVDLGRMPGDRSRRGVLLAEVNVAGRPLLVAGTHMSHLRHASPVQVQRLRRALPPPQDVAAALLGDMNLFGPPLVLLLPGWRRGVRARTFPAWRPLAQSDHVLVTPRVGVRRGEVLRVGNSDHLAVRATLIVP